MITDEDLYAFGNSGGVKGPRTGDFGIDDEDETVGPCVPAGASERVPGASTFTEPGRAPLTGYYYLLPADLELPLGLGLHADGEDVGGLAPWGHRTIYPTMPMTFARFRDLVLGLPWQRAGKAV